MKHTPVFLHLFLCLLLSYCLLGTGCTSTHSLEPHSTHPDFSWNNPHLNNSTVETGPRLASSGRPRLEPKKIESLPSTGENTAIQTVPPAEKQEAAKEEVYQNSTLASKYTIKKGDSLWIIAKRHGVLLEDLLSYNGLRKDSLLKVGQELLIPTVKAPMPSQNTTLTLEDQETYIIQSGDTLSEISVAARSSLSEIKQINHLQSESIQIGQKLSLPKGTQERLRKIKASASKVKNQNTTWPDNTYTVKAGDTLSGIAYNQKVTLKELMELNNIQDAHALRAGQKLKMPQGVNKHESEALAKADSAHPTTTAHLLDANVPSTTYSPSPSTVSATQTNNGSAEKNSLSKEDDEGIFDDLTEAPLISIEEEATAKQHEG